MDKIFFVGVKPKQREEDLSFLFQHSSDFGSWNLESEGDDEQKTSDKGWSLEEDIDECYESGYDF